MVKGEDAVARKRNRGRRKRMRGKEAVSARVAAVIASKRRRKSGKRRICEGMCFTLPTPEDPFNDRNDPKAKREMTINKSSDRNTIKEKRTLHKPENEKSDECCKLVVESVQPMEAGIEKVGLEACPSKFLILCLNAIENARIHDGSLHDDGAKELSVSKWGFNFWRHYSGGFDILDVSGSARTEQIAWLVSTVSDIITRKEKEGTYIQSPYLLYIVSSQERAVKVRTVFKPLKDLGLHTVSLHPGATVEHQVQGLKNCEPEFLISTPERLLQLITLGALDISKVPLLVLDGLTTLISSGFTESIKSIRFLIVGSPQTVIFTNSCGDESTLILSSLTRPPVRKISLDDSL